VTNITYKKQVHRQILKQFPLLGRPPTIEELTETLKHLSVADIHQALDELEKEDAIFIDHEHDRIVAAYPYSPSKTSHTVSLDDGTKVWAMCAIDALGIHFMTNQDITIDSVSLQSGRAIRIRLEKGRVTQVEPSNIAVWRAARKGSEMHDAITSCPGTNFIILAEVPEQSEQIKDNKNGEVISLSDAIKRSIDLFGSLLD
jgi:hypothetical protein